MPQEVVRYVVVESFTVPRSRSSDLFLKGTLANEGLWKYRE